MIRSGGFLGRLLSPLLKTRLPLIKNVNVKSVLTPLGLNAAASAADVRIRKKYWVWKYDNTNNIK